MTAPAAPPLQPVPCRRCGRLLRDAKSIELEIGPTCFRRLAGQLAPARPAAPPAAAQVEMRVCSTCGCHDLNRCTRGCGWVERNLCSTCADGEHADG